MSALGAYDDRAAVGRRIGQARRELGLTQGELATRIGVTLGILDRFETGKADPSDKLAQIAEATGRQVSWFTSTTRLEAAGDGGTAAFLAEVGQRIAESRGRRGLTRRELAQEVGIPLGKIERYESGAESPAGFVEKIASALGEPSSWLETGDLSARAEELGNSYSSLWDERAELAQRLDELQAELAEERRKHEEAVAEALGLEQELARASADKQAVADLLEQSRSELADARMHDEQLTGRVSELETELRLAEERAATAADRLDRAEADSERRREHERSLAEELELRQVELSVRSAELDTREAAVSETERTIEDRRRSLAEELELREVELSVRSAELDTREAAVSETERTIEDRRRALGDVELHAAAVERREEALRLRESELEHRAGVLTELAHRLDKLRKTAGTVESPRPVREDEHLLIVSGHGYRLAARWGAVPAPGEVVELDDGRYRCMRISTSPFLGDDRLCAVLEPVTAAYES